MKLIMACSQILMRGGLVSGVVPKKVEEGYRLSQVIDAS